MSDHHSAAALCTAMIQAAVDPQCTADVICSKPYSAKNRKWISHCLSPSPHSTFDFWESPPNNLIYCAAERMPPWNSKAKVVINTISGCRRPYGDGPGYCNAKTQIINAGCQRDAECLCGLPVDYDFTELRAAALEHATKDRAVKAAEAGTPVDSLPDIPPESITTRAMIDQLLLHPERNWSLAVAYWGTLCTCNADSLTEYAKSSCLNVADRTQPFQEACSG